MEKETFEFKKSKTINNLKSKNKYFRQLAIEGYDPQKIPADKTIAEKHMGASKVGREAQPSSLKSGEYLQMCPCCSKYIQKEPLSVGCNIIELSFLGSGYPMYFEFIRFCIQLLTILLLFNGLYGLITNGAFGNACVSQDGLNKLSASEQKDKCYKNWVTILSLGNKQSEDKLLVAQSFLNVISIFIIIMLFQRFRRTQRQIDIDCDENDVQANDYCALFSNIPSTIDYQGDPQKFDFAEILKQHFSVMLIPGRQIEIVKVGLCFNCDPMIKRKQELKKLIMKKQTLIIQALDVQKVSQKIVDVQNKKTQLQLEYYSRQSQEFIKKNFTGHAYVIFQKEQDKEDVIKHYQQRSLVERWILWHTNQKFMYENNEIQIAQAPDPNNINWKYLKFNKNQKMKRRILFFFLTVICLGGCLSIILGLNYAQTYVTSYETDSKFEVSLISIAISVCIVLLNPLLKYIIVQISIKEGCSTTTSLFVSIAIRSAFASFLNCSIILIFTQVIIVNKGSVFGKLFGKGGLALNINTVFITQTIISNLTKLINPLFIMKQLTKKGVLKYLDKYSLVSQSQLNSICENPEFKIEEEYAYILQIIYSTLFYAPVLPLCIIWGIIILFAKYWIDKYNLIKNSTVKFNPSLNLCLQMTEMLEYCLPLYSLSNMLAFIYITKGEIHTLSIFGFLIGLFHAFLPMQELNQKLFPLRERVPNECTYDEFSNYFGMDYDRENPVINDIAIQEHINKVRGQISSIHKNKKDFNKYVTTFQNDIETSQKSLEKLPIIQDYPNLNNQYETDGNRDCILLTGQNSMGDNKDGFKFSYQPQNTDQHPFLEKKQESSSQNFTPFAENQSTEFQNLTEKHNQSNEKQQRNKKNQDNHTSNKNHVQFDIDQDQNQKNKQRSESFKQKSQTNVQQADSSDDDDEAQDDFINSYKPQAFDQSPAKSEKKKKASVFTRNKDHLKSYKPQKTVFRQGDDYGIELQREDDESNQIADKQQNVLQALEDNQQKLTHLNNQTNQNWSQSHKQQEIKTDQHISDQDQEVVNIMFDD